MSMSRRTIVVSLAVFAAVIVAAGAVTLSPLGLEHWYLFRLRSGGLESRRRAALGLGKLRAYDAIPVLLDELAARAPQDAEREIDLAGTLFTTIMLSSTESEDLWLKQAEPVADGSWTEFDYTVRALEAMGAGARGILMRFALEDERRIVRCAAANAVRLGQIRERAAARK